MGFCTVCRSPSAPQTDEALMSGVAIKALSRWLRLVERGICSAGSAAVRRSMTGRPVVARRSTPDES